MTSLAVVKSTFSGPGEKNEKPPLVLLREKEPSGKMANIAGLESGSGEMTVLCVRTLIHLVGRNVSSDIGNASPAL